MKNQLFMSKKFLADLQNLSISAHMVKECCENLQLNNKTCRDIDLAVSEAVSNAIRHTETLENSAVTLRIVSNGNKIIIEVEDNGPGFDLDTVKTPDLNIPHEGGYGIFLIGQVMDHLSYESKEGCNVLVMEKNIPAKQMKED